MIRETTAIILLAALGAAGCNKAAPAKVDTASIEKQLRQNEAQWQQSYAAHDAKALAANYAEDASMANPGSPLVTGKDAISKAVAEFAADPNLKVDFAADRVQVAASGDLAYTRGHYTLTMTDAATKKPVAGSGTYLTVYRKQADGSWKAVEDFTTPSAAAAK
jgi:uncharacterized protein (TIGR02246 family)